MSKEKLEDILKTIEIEDIKSLRNFILSSKEYQKLFRCTQMRDEVLRDDEDKTMNRGLHTIQVATNSQKLALYLLERKNGKNLANKYENVLNEDEQKQVLIAELVGITHDLGHLPMAHASEIVCGDKIGNGYKFRHEQYGGIVFSILFKKFLEDIELTHEKKEIEKIQNSGIEDYIIEGIQNHGKYLSYESSERARDDLPLVCGRLADTLSFMPSDLQGLCQVDRADDIQGKILSKDIIMKLVRDGVTTTIGIEDTKGVENSENLPTEKIVSDEQTLELYYKINNPNFDYEKVIDDLASGNHDRLVKIQAQILQEVATANVKVNGEISSPVIAISDNLKLLRQAEYNLRGKKEKKFRDLGNIPDVIKDYERKKFKAIYQGKEKDFDKDFKEYLVKKVCEKSFCDYQNDLNQETNSLRKSCPTLALIYEIQDEFVYNQLLYKSTKVLGNDEAENKKVLSATFDKFEKEYLTLDMQAKKEFERIYQIFQKYMSLEKDGKDNSKERHEELRAKAYAAYKLQQLTNDDIDQERESRDYLEAVRTRDFSKIMKARAVAKEIGDYEEEAIAFSESFELVKKIFDYEKIYGNLEPEEQKTQRDQLIIEQSEKNKIESRTVTKGIPDYTNPNTQHSTETQRVSIFGVDSWKKIIGDRTVANLQDMAIKIKNTRNKQKIRLNGIDTLEPR